MYIFTDDPIDIWCNDAINNPGMNTKGSTVSSTISKYAFARPLFLSANKSYLVR